MLPYKTYAEKRAQLLSGSLSLEENVRFFLNQIEEKKHLNAFPFVFAEEALENARVVQQKLSEGTAGKLAGMVIAIKDVLSIKEKPTTCSSKILSNFVSLYTATSVQRLIEEDAIIIGKTNCDEFAMGSSNENSAFGNVLNPCDETCVPGGSSGGSAVAVAAELCDVSLGTDTGGSIRQPASFCGIYGLKPTYGRVSRYGLTAFASSFDSIGPFSRSIYDAALVLEVMSGKDPHDSTSATRPNPEFTSALSVETPRFTIGVPKEYFGSGLAPAIKTKLTEILESLKAQGFTLKDISLPHTDYSIATYYILTTAEASSNLARYDGARYGVRADKTTDALIEDLGDMYLASRSEGFGKEVKRRIMLGTYVLSAGYYDAYYIKAQKVRRIIQNDFLRAFKECDLIFTPTTPTTAFKFGEKSDNPLEMYLNDIFTTSANLAGIPGISIPAGADEKGLPFGVQLMANLFEEEKLFTMGKFLEKSISR